jgi:hypothetical protein
MGGDDNDLINGSLGNDTISGDAGDDRIQGSNLSDYPGNPQSPIADLNTINMSDMDSLLGVPERTRSPEPSERTSSMAKVTPTSSTPRAAETPPTASTQSSAEQATSSSETPKTLCCNPATQVSRPDFRFSHEDTKNLCELLRVFVPSCEPFIDRLRRREVSDTPARV